MTDILESVSENVIRLALRRGRAHTQLAHALRAAGLVEIVAQSDERELILTELGRDMLARLLERARAEDEA